MGQIWVFAPPKFLTKIWQRVRKKLSHWKISSFSQIRVVYSEMVVFNFSGSILNATFWKKVVVKLRPVYCTIQYRNFEVLWSKVLYNTIPLKYCILYCISKLPKNRYCTIFTRLTIVVKKVLYFVPRSGIVLDF